VFCYYVNIIESIYVIFTDKLIYTSDTTEKVFHRISVSTTAMDRKYCRKELQISLVISSSISQSTSHFTVAKELDGEKCEEKDLSSLSMSSNSL